jgi:hypothetical protein
MQWWTLRVILICSAFALAACSHEQRNPERKYPEAPGLGVVVLSVSHDLADATQTGAYFYLDEKLIGGKGLLSTPPRGIPSEFKNRYGQVLILSLVPGQHSIDRWTMETQISMRKPKNLPAPLVFQVQEGEVIYIGNLHLRFKVEPGLFDVPVVSAVVPVVRDNAAEDIEIAEKKAPALLHRIATQLLPLGPWLPRQE